MRRRRDIGSSWARKWNSSRDLQYCRSGQFHAYLRPDIETRILELVESLDEDANCPVGVIFQVKKYWHSRLTYGNIDFVAVVR